MDKRRLQSAGAQEHQREGHRILVTSLEAALVDCLALLSRSPPPLDLMEAFIDARRRAKAPVMIEHALSHQNPALCARLGFFLMCADYHLESSQRTRLRRGCSGRQTHFQKSKADPDTDRYFPPWDLIVPRELYALVPGAE